MTNSKGQIISYHLKWVRAHVVIQWVRQSRSENNFHNSIIFQSFIWVRGQMIDRKGRRHIFSWFPVWTLTRLSLIHRLTSFPVSAEEKCHHSMLQLPPCFTVRKMCSGWCPVCFLQSVSEYVGLIILFQSKHYLDIFWTMRWVRLYC